MASWTVEELVTFAKARDLAGPAATLRASGVNGAALLCLDENALVNDARATPLAARKLLRARDAFLAAE